ncbi:hypothetical protein U1Q18_051097, partial [Sarracenia purpurea var. burkii]
MIYLIEGVLPESYFANSLRGLSIDMAVFRDLLRLKFPELSKLLEQLQTGSNDTGSYGVGSRIRCICYCGLDRYANAKVWIDLP